MAATPHSALCPEALGVPKGHRATQLAWRSRQEQFPAVPKRQQQLPAVPGAAAPWFWRGEQQCWSPCGMFLPAAPGKPFPGGGWSVKAVGEPWVGQLA